MSSCPRCQKELEASQLDNISVRLCQACRGILIAHADLAQILESSWHAVSEEQADRLSFSAKEDWKSEPVLACPDCRQPMEKYGYMGMAAILIDRCDRCNLVWLDTAELQSMVLALAQTNYRSRRTLQREFASRLTPLGGGIPSEQKRTDNGPFDDSAGEAAVAVQALLRLFLK